MNPEQQHAILTLVLFAAFADGEKHAREREEIRRIAESLADGAGMPDLMRLHQDVLLRRTRLEEAARRLLDPGHRRLAYEMALHVCEADGQVSEVERRFLDGLKGLLALHGPGAELIEAEAGAVVDLAGAAMPVSGTPDTLGGPGGADTDLDKSILHYSLLNGALELLPQSWASLAIIPLQVKMVYEVGRAHGVSLDRGHIREFIAAAGVGLTSQYLEQLGRRLLGKAFGKAGSGAAGMAFSFATTYALGQLAKRYYAGGRRMDGILLRETFQELLVPARQLQTQYLPRIRQQAETLDMGRVLDLARGG